MLVSSGGSGAGADTSVETKGRFGRSALTPGLLLGFLVVVAVVIGAYVLSAFLLRSVRDTASVVAHTQAVKGGLEEMLGTLVDAETGQRGFVITGSRAYLEPYDSARDLFPQQIADVRALVADDAEQVADLDRFGMKASVKFDELARVVDARRQSGFAAAQALVADSSGRRMMDEMRAIVARMEAREDALLADRVAVAAESYRSARRTAVVSTVVALLALLALFFAAQRQGAERLRAADLARRLDVTLASIGDAVIATDARGRVTRLNAVATALTGWPEADALGRPVAEVFAIVDEESRKPAENPVDRVLREDRVAGLANHTILVSRDGRETTIDDSAAPIRGEDGTLGGVVMVFRDVTARRQADRRKDEFLAMLAHELRNPLGAITNAAEILGRLGPREGNLRWARDVIERQAQHLARIVDDLLDVSRVSRGRIVLRRQSMPVASAIGLALETARPLIEGRGQAFTSDVPEDVLWVDADTTRLAQVIGNLLSNASKYTPPEGALSLSLRKEGGEAVVRVRDTGIGIAPELLPRIFELFVQGDRPTDWFPGGLGLGLTLAKRLTEMHGGRLEAASAGVGKGSEFVLRLPLVEPADARPARAGAPARGAAFRRRILVVDDNADSRESLVLALEMAGHEVRGAFDGPSALEAASVFRPEVVLLDIGLPGMDGYEVARRLRTPDGRGDFVLVALTGYGQHADRERAREAGFDHHLVKPASPDAILALVAR